MQKYKKEAEDLVNGFRVILMNEDTDCGHEILCTCIAIKHAKIVLEESKKELERVNSYEYRRYNAERIGMINLKLNYLETL